MLERLKKATNVYEAIKEMEVILQEIKKWDYDLSKPSEEPTEKIASIAYALGEYGRELPSRFYDNLLGEEFDELRARFDHMNLAHLYINAGACYSIIGNDPEKIDRAYTKAGFHVQACEIDKYGLDYSYKLHANYHRTRAMDAFRRKQYDLSKKHLKEGVLFLKRLMAIVDDETRIHHLQLAIYDLKNVEIAIYNQLGQLEKSMSLEPLLEEMSEFVKQSPLNSWKRLYFLRVNLGVAFARMGEYKKADDQFLETIRLCEIYQPHRQLESRNFHAPVTYRLLVLAMQGSEEVPKIYNEVQHFQSLGNAKQHAYFLFLAEWSMAIYYLNSRHNDENLIKNYFFKAKALVTQAKLEDFQEEWVWFEEKLQSSNHAQILKNISNSPFKLFKNLLLPEKS